MTETVPSSGRGGTAAVVAQNEQTTEEHSTVSVVTFLSGAGKWITDCFLLR